MTENSMQKPSMNWKAENLHREWQRFNKDFSYYCMGPSTPKEEEVKVGYLLLFVGERGHEIHESVSLSKENQKKLKENLMVFKNFTSPRKNTLRSGYKFDRRQQGEVETFDNFVTDLRIILRYCGFQDGDRRLGDAIVFNCHHEKVREKCLDEGDKLTLEKAIKIGQTNEILQMGLKELKRSEDPTVNSFHKSSKRGEMDKRGVNPEMELAEAPVRATQRADSGAKWTSDRKNAINVVCQ
ncbi:hypothetical protein CAPTEDRAFT_210932, partial [Capitella teleta]